MAAFVAYADESAGERRDGYFYWCGFIAPEPDWRDRFAPGWTRRVLKGPPAIPHLHMTDIRNPHWRRRHGIGDEDAQARVDAAFEVISDVDTLFPVGMRVDAGHFQAALATTKLESRPRTLPYAFEPDYLCFSLFALGLLSWVSRLRPECDRLDFVVERNRGISGRLVDFYGALSGGATALGHPELGKLIGTFTTAGKEHVSLQAADLLCWYTQRPDGSGLDDRDKRRFETIARRNGWRQDLTKDEITRFAARAAAAGIVGPED